VVGFKGAEAEDKVQVRLMWRPYFDLVSSQARFAADVTSLAWSEEELQQVIKTAFQRSVRRPEVQTDPGLMNELLEARAVLADAARRKMYMSQQNHQAFVARAESERRKEKGGFGERRREDGGAFEKVDFEAAVRQEAVRQQARKQKMEDMGGGGVESARARQRREAQGKGVRLKERGQDQAERWAEAANKLRHQRTDEVHRIGGNLPNQCRAPFLHVASEEVRKNFTAGGKQRFNNVWISWRCTSAVNDFVEHYQLEAMEAAPGAPAPLGVDLATEDDRFTKHYEGPMTDTKV
jgi:hypothetical protein